MIFPFSDFLCPGSILPNTKTHLEASCKLEDSIWPLAILGHTHDRGTQVTGWVINKDQTKWQILGSANPQKSQYFRQLEPNTKGKLSEKDILAVRCGYTNPLPNIISTGGSRKDEMCALYLLYFTNKSTISRPYCIGGQVLV